MTRAMAWRPLAASRAPTCRSLDAIRLPSTVVCKGHPSSHSAALSQPLICPPLPPFCLIHSCLRLPSPQVLLGGATIIRPILDAAPMMRQQQADGPYSLVAPTPAIELPAPPPPPPLPSPRPTMNGSSSLPMAQGFPQSPQQLPSTRSYDHRCKS